VNDVLISAVNRRGRTTDCRLLCCEAATPDKLFAHLSPINIIWWASQRQSWSAAGKVTSGLKYSTIAAFQTRWHYYKRSQRGQTYSKADNGKTQ